MREEWTEPCGCRKIRTEAGTFTWSCDLHEEEAALAWMLKNGKPTTLDAPVSVLKYMMKMEPKGDVA